jgi:hypothetical protein
MNKNFLISIVAGLMLIFASLACGTASKTTTTTYSATPESSSNTPESSSNPSNPSQSSTATPQPQIDLQTGSYSYYVDSIGTLWFVGEIVNNGDAPAGSIQVVLSLLDNSGNVVGVGSDSPSFVQAKGKFPFKIMVDKAPKEWKDVKIQIQGTPLDSQSFMPPYIDLKTDKVTGKPSDFGGYELTGTVINTGQQTATLVHIVAAAYDKDGKVIDVGDTFATLNDIAPSGDSPFSLQFSNLTEAPASYEVFAVGYSK